jgi:dCMP deaminase
MRKILVVGHARHGKDTVSEYLAEALSLNYVSTSKVCAPYVRMAHNKHKGIDYVTDEECWEDRVNHRDFWCSTISNYCAFNKTAVADLVYDKYEIYNGVRKKDEYNAIVDKYDPIVIWVDAAGRKPLEDTMEIECDSTMIKVNNNGSKDDLVGILAMLVDNLSNNKWHQRMFDLAKMAASWSKDPNSKVGAVVVEPRFRNFAIGYNGLPTGLVDTPDRILNKSLMLHAEINAVYKASGSVKGWYIFSTKAPCVSCALHLIQLGISAVHCPSPEESSKWYESNLQAISLLTEANIKVCFNDY